MKRYLVYSFLLIGLSTFAQRKELKGKVWNEENIEGIHVLNNTARVFTITDEKGAFVIEAKENDTIYFNSLVYKVQGFVVTEHMMETEKIQISLEEDVTQLKEVVVGRKLTGSITEDIKQVKLKDSVNFDDVGIPGFKGIPEEKIVPIVPAIGLGVAVDIEALYKHASGYYKSLRIGRGWEKENKTIIKIYDYFGHEFYIENYQLTEENLYEFLLACVETDGFVTDFNKGNNELILKTFTEIAKKFKSQN